MCVVMLYKYLNSVPLYNKYTHLLIRYSVKRKQTVPVKIQISKNKYGNINIWQTSQQNRCMLAEIWCLKVCKTKKSANGK